MQRPADPPSQAFSNARETEPIRFDDQATAIDLRRLAGRSHQSARPRTARACPLKGRWITATTTTAEPKLCRDCGREFSRSTGRGRPSDRCPECRTANRRKHGERPARYRPCGRDACARKFDEANAPVRHPWHCSVACMLADSSIGADGAVWVLDAEHQGSEWRARPRIAGSLANHWPAMSLEARRLLAQTFQPGRPTVRDVAQISGASHQ